MRSLTTFLIIFVFTFSSFTNAQVNLNSGLSAYYSFNGSFQDMSGNGNHGTQTGGTSFGTDHAGNPNAAAYFDGIDDWVAITSAASITASDKMTVSFRFNAANGQNQQVLLSKGNLTNVGSYVYNQQFQIGVFCSQSIGNDNLFFATDHDNTCQATGGMHHLFNSQPTSINTWYCVVMTFDSGVKRIFVNGVLNATQTITSADIDSCNGGTLKFGMWWQNDALYYNGLLDEVRFYKRVLNTQEIDSLCNLNSPGTTELAERLNIDVMNITPNPAFDRVRIELPARWNDHNLELFNETGQKVYGIKQHGSRSDIDCGHLPAGLYFVKCRHEDEIVTGKFVKQ